VKWAKIAVELWPSRVPRVFNLFHCDVLFMKLSAPGAQQVLKILQMSGVKGHRTHWMTQERRYLPGKPICDAWGQGIFFFACPKLAILMNCE
jgi:hypothetical protein